MTALVWATDRRLAKTFLVTGCFLTSFVRLRVGGLNLTISDILFILAAGTMTANHRRWNWRGFCGSAYLDLAWFIAIALMVGGFVISGLVRDADFDTISIPAQYIFAWAVVPLIISSSGQDIARVLLLSFTRGLVCMCAISLVFYFFFPDSPLNLRTGIGRLTSMMENPNELAKTIVAAFPCIMLARDRKWIGIREFIISLATLVLALVGTISFGGWTAFALLLAIVMFAGGRRKMAVVVPALIIAGGLMLALLGTPEAVLNRAQPIIRSGSLDRAGSQSHKIEMMKEAWPRVQQSPIIGLGPGRYDDSSAFPVPVHNTYLLIWVEGGLLSITGMLTGMAAIFFASLAWAIHSRDRYQGTLAISMIVVFLFNCMTNTHIYSRFFLVPLIVFLNSLTAEDGMKT